MAGVVVRAVHADKAVMCGDDAVALGDARVLCERHWQRTGAEPEDVEALMKDVLLVHPEAPTPIYLYLAGLGKGVGTGFCTTAILDSPGSDASLCSFSAVAGLPSVVWTDLHHTVTVGGHIAVGTVVTVPLTISYAWGLGIGRGQWSVRGSTQDFIVLDDADFARVVGPGARPDCMALLGVDFARNLAFSDLVARIQAALGSPGAPHVATHILRSAWLGREMVRGSQQLPVDVLLHPLHESPADGPLMVPLRCGDRASFNTRHSRAADLGAATLWKRDSLLPYAPYSYPFSIPPLDALGASHGAPSADTPIGFAPLDETDKATVVPVEDLWTDKQSMWDAVVANCVVGDISAGARDRLRDVLWERRAAFGKMAPRKGDALTLKLKPGARPSQSGLLRYASTAQNKEIKSALTDFASAGVAEEVTDAEHIKRLNILPIVLVHKPDGAWRFCLDFRELNAQLDDTAHTRLPDVAELLSQYVGCTLFSCFDEPKSFNQIRVSDASADWMAASFVDDVTGRRRYFRFNGAQLGLKPLTWLCQQEGEKVTARVIRDNPGVRASLFVDDHNVGSQPLPSEDVLAHEQRHINSLDTLFAAQIDRGHVFALKKAQFMVRQASIYGCVTDGHTVTIDPARMSGWTHMRVPAAPTLKWAQSFLGTLIYCAPYLGPTYQRDSSILWDLVAEAERAHSTATAQGDKGARARAQRLLGKWTAAHTSAAERCIELAKANSCLLYWRPEEACWVTADASDTGFSVFLQQRKPDGTLGIVAILSRRFTANQRLWSVGARELYALLEFMRRFGHMVAFASATTFCTDHLNLLAAPDLENAYVRRWLCELMQFPAFVSLIHLPGRCNALADYLSRWCVAETDIAPPGALPVPVVEDSAAHQWARARRRGSAVASTRPQEDPDVVVRLTHAAAGGAPPVPPAPRARRNRSPAPAVPDLFTNPHASQYSPLVRSILEAQHGLSARELADLCALPHVSRGTLDGAVALFHKGRLIIPDKVPQLVGAVLSLLHDDSLHAHTSKMLDALQQAQLYLPRAREVMDHYCATCPDCQRAAAPDAVQSHRARLLVPPRAHPWEHIFLDYAALPSSGEHSKLLILIDAATRYTLLVPSGHAEEGAASVRALQQWREVFPRVVAVHTDGGPGFKGAFLTYCAEHSITVDRGTAYNSKGRGLVERLVKKVKEAMRRLLPPGKPETWVNHVGELQILLNRMPHAGLGGLSPQQVGMVGAEAHIPPFFAGKAVLPDTQQWQDLMESLRYLRAITEICGEVSDVKRKVAHDAAVAAGTPYAKGDWCLIYHNERLSSLDSFYRGPYTVVDVQVDAKGGNSGYYTVAPVLANNTLGKPHLGVHANRMWPFSAERTSAEAEHWKRLPEGCGLVLDILNHRLHAQGAQVQVKYYSVKRPVWEFIGSMKINNLGWNAVYRDYCESRELPLDGGAPWHNPDADRNGRAEE